MTDKIAKRKHRNRAVQALMKAFPQMGQDSAEAWIDSVRAHVNAGKSRAFYLGNKAPPHIAPVAWDVYEQTSSRLAAILM